MNEKKEFDCVEMKHRAASRVHRELKGKSVSERLSYWRKRKRAMAKRLRRTHAA